MKSATRSAEVTPDKDATQVSRCSRSDCRAGPRAVRAVRVVLHKGSGFAARRSPWLLEGGDTDIWRAGGPNAAQPELLTVSRPYIRPESGDGKQGSQARSCPPWPCGHRRRPKRGRRSSSVNLGRSKYVRRCGKGRDS